MYENYKNYTLQDKFYRNFGLLTFFPLDVEPNDIYDLCHVLPWDIICFEVQPLVYEK